MYYVDTFAGELVKEKEVNAPPERYYEYRKGTLDGVIIETYIKPCSPLKLLDYARSIDTPSGLAYVERCGILTKNGLPTDAPLFRYTVPPKWYDEEVAKYEKGGIE